MSLAGTTRNSTDPATALLAFHIRRTVSLAKQKALSLVPGTSYASFGLEQVACRICHASIHVCQSMEPSPELQHARVYTLFRSSFWINALHTSWQATTRICQSARFELDCLMHSQIQACICCAQLVCSEIVLVITFCVLRPTKPMYTVSVVEFLP